tara:strand:+ start:1428 stop:2003 length:576 start_codon:yes stop_codon:yes gene_type:complete
VSILKSEINLKGTKPRFYRSTKNFYCHFVDGFELVFSYQTLIAIRSNKIKILRKKFPIFSNTLISVNNWSNTTARHLYWFNPNKDIRVTDFEEQARKILKDNNLLDETNPLKMVATISSLFSIMANDETEEQIRATNNQRKRFYLTQQGILFPEDWDALSVADQKKRLDMADLVGLDKADEVLNSPTSKTI